jgi:hypothetical protein
MTKLDISRNDLRAEGGRALAVGLKGNQVMKEFNIAGNELTLNASGSAHDDMSGVTAVANTISGMGAMTKFDISSNDFHAEGGKALAAGLKGNQVITELNISSNKLNSFRGDTCGVIAIADVIPDMGALTSLNLATNIFGVEGAKIIAAVLPRCT